jgi:glycosyltransferase involved in cell wall biosynthesis
MRIAMFTNTYLPHVGGVARSVKTAADACRERGHEVRIIAPVFEGAEPSPEVLRVPAIQNFNGSDFSVRLPLPLMVRDFIIAFDPDLIHSHHPFLLGDTALREAWKQQIPVLFTHHTLYERYTHYVPLDSPALKRVAIQLATEYCNRCNHVIAPSESIANLLREREVTVPIEVIPTGIDTAFFASGNGPRFRERLGIPPEARVIGHVGRIAREKNVVTLARAVALCLHADPRAVFLIVGEGDARDEMLAILNGEGAGHRVHAVGTKTGAELSDAYAAMDGFIFASQTETQGLVLAEAMAAGKPVVALDGPGVREIVRDGENGRLLPGESSVREFADAMDRLMHDPELSRRCSKGAREAAEAFSTERCAGRLLECYQRLLAQAMPRRDVDSSLWDRVQTGVGIEWKLLEEKMAALAAAVTDTPATRTLPQ